MGNPVRRCCALVKSINVVWHPRVGNTALGQGRIRGRWWQRHVGPIALLVSNGLLSGGVGAAERTRPFRIGVLTESWGPTPAVVGLREGLLALGYREDEQFVIGVRFTQGDLAALPTAAREIVQLGVDLIFVSQASTAKAAKLTTDRIPIVFAGVGDPLGSGLVQSFARPGGNITGVTNLSLDLSPKRLELFRETLPGLRRVLHPYDPADAQAMAQVGVYREAARRLGIELLEQAVHSEAEAHSTLAKVWRGDVDGILAPDALSFNIPGFILEAAPQQAIPTMFAGAFWVERGGLASYGPDYYGMGRQSARLVDKILKGVNPGEIPVEVKPKIEFAINLKVAKSLGITIAPEILYQADRLVR
jgi:putative ABC transport system substrate-binding protein